MVICMYKKYFFLISGLIPISLAGMLEAPPAEDLFEQLDMMPYSSLNLAAAYEEMGLPPPDIMKIKSEPNDNGFNYEKETHKKIGKKQLDKIYLCSAPECLKIFKTPKERANHFARWHCKEKPFICNYGNCSKKYSTKSSLNLHNMRIHGEKKFHCLTLLCAAKYAVRGDLTQHIKRKHKIKTPSRV